MLLHFYLGSNRKCWPYSKKTSSPQTCSPLQKPEPLRGQISDHKKRAGGERPCPVVERKGSSVCSPPGRGFLSQTRGWGWGVWNKHSLDILDPASQLLFPPPFSPSWAQLAAMLRSPPSPFQHIRNPLSPPSLSWPESSRILRFVAPKSLTTPPLSHWPPAQLSGTSCPNPPPAQMSQRGARAAAREQQPPDGLREAWRRWKLWTFWSQILLFLPHSRAFPLCLKDITWRVLTWISWKTQLSFSLEKKIKNTSPFLSIRTVEKWPWWPVVFKQCLISSSEMFFKPQRGKKIGKKQK